MGWKNRPPLEKFWDPPQTPGPLGMYAINRRECILAVSLDCSEALDCIKYDSASIVMGPQNGGWTKINLWSRGMGFEKKNLHEEKDGCNDLLYYPLHNHCDQHQQLDRK